MAFRCLGRLETREGDDLLGVRMPVETNDRGLAQHRLDDSPGADRVVPDRCSRARAGVRREDYALADTEWWRGLLARPRRSPGGRRRTRGWRCDHHRRGYRHDDLLLIVLVDLDDNPDLDRDVIGVVGIVQLDRVTLRHLGGRGLGLFLIGFDSGVGWFFGHSGSYVTDG
jgi:hypothetical protein